MTKEEKNRDKYYQKKYGITLADYERMLSEQEGKCGICKRPPSSIRLAVDHDHKFHYFKIRIKQIEGVVPGSKAWEAFSPDVQYWFVGPNKSESIREIRKVIKRCSVRGLLCWACNTGLKKWRDNPDLMESAAKYIRAFKDKQ